MNIAKLNERLTIQKNTVVVDENANHRNSWEDYFSCATYAFSFQQGEKNEAGLTLTNDTLEFTVRYCSELAVLDGTHYRIVFRGIIYNITSVDMMNYDKKSIKIMGKVQSRDDGV